MVEILCLCLYLIIILNLCLFVLVDKSKLFNNFMQL